MSFPHSCIQISLFYSIELIGNLTDTTCKSQRRPLCECVKDLRFQHAVVEIMSVWQWVGKFLQSVVFKDISAAEFEFRSFFKQQRDKWELVSALINEVFIISCFASAFHPLSHALSLFCLLARTGSALHNESGNNGRALFHFSSCSSSFGSRLDECHSSFFISLSNSQWLLSMNED